MLAVIWSLLTSKFAGTIASAVAAVFLGLFVWTWAASAFTEHELRGQLKTAQTDLGTARFNLGVAQAAVAGANAATIKLQQESQARTANATAAVTGLQAQLRAALSKEGALAKRPAPASPAAACTDLNALFLESVQ